MDTTSASLLARLRRPGDSDAWLRFVHLYSPILYSWAGRMGLRHEDAADLVQDVFAVLVQKLPEFDYDEQKRFRGWLWTVTRNKWREKCRRPALPLDASRPPDEVAGPELESLEEAEFRDHLVRQIVPSLQPQFHPGTWQAFWGHVVDSRPAADVAAELGVSVAAVYKAKVRVLARLHQELADLVTD
jgi:RNA polymerase sigma-70 factor (ECF subfamily)